MIELPLVPVILKSKVLFLPTDEADVSGGRFISGTRLIALGYFPRELASSLTQPAALASPPPKPAATAAVTHFSFFLTFNTKQRDATGLTVATG